MSSFMRKFSVRGKVKKLKKAENKPFFLKHRQQN